MTLKMKRILLIISLILSIFLTSCFEMTEYPSIIDAKYEISRSDILWPYFSNDFEINGSYVILHGYFSWKNNKYVFHQENIVLGDIINIIERIEEEK